MWNFKSLHSFIHELKHKEVAVRSRGEDIFIIKARLDVRNAATMIVVHV